MYSPGDEEINNSVRRILNELDDGQERETPIEKPKELQPPKELVKSVQKPETAPALPARVKPKPLGQVVGNVGGRSLPVSAQPVAPLGPSQSPQNLDRLTEKFHAVYAEVLDNLRLDRQQLDQYINIYAMQIQGESPKQSYIEGLVALLTAKSKTTADASKLLDTCAKMIAASKSIALGDKTAKAPRGELDRLMDSTEFDPSAP